LFWLFFVIFDSVAFVYFFVQTAYFAALTLNEFAKNKQFAADWGHIKIMSGAILNWSDETSGEVDKLTVFFAKREQKLLSKRLKTFVYPTTRFFFF
jgi:hypothetical protein